MKIDGHIIEISHPDKSMYPADAITKKQVVDYYLKISPKMLPLITGRPIVLQRWPDGIESEGFYQKQASDYFPKWIKTTTVDLVKGGKQQLVLIDSAAALVYLANQAVLTFHIWTSKTPQLKKPDRMIFDLDPSTKNFPQVVKAAELLHKLLQDKSYKPWLMTTGSRGLHLVVPIEPRHPFEAVRAEAEEIAAEAASEDENLTTEVRKAKRDNHIYVDVARNGYGQTQVAPYSLRAIAGAPVAIPIPWQSLNNLSSAQDYSIDDFKTSGKSNAR